MNGEHTPHIEKNIDYDRLPIPSSDLIGRSKELARLDRAFEDPKTYVISIIAGGGVGKSALTYSWLDKLKPGYGGAKRIFGWSFYSQGSHDTQNSSAPFFQEALKFFGYDKELPKDEVEKGKELAKCLRDKPCLLILDGMEPLQHPVKILNGEIRDTALKELLRCVRLYGLSEKSLVVISSRQPIVEYEQWKQGYEKIDLNVLNDMYAADLLNKFNVRGSREDLEKAGRDMGGHALSLVLLGRLLTERFNGDVLRRDRLPNLFEDPKNGGHALRILRYYDGEYWQEPEFLKRFWNRLFGKIAPERIFMRLLGLFDRPMGLNEKQILCKKAEFAKPLAALNDDDFKALEKRLENAGLLLKSDKSGIRTEWDCHPLIRNYFGHIFRKEEEKAFQQAHRVLFEYYQAVPEKHQPDTLEEMEPLYRAVVHGCLAGEYLESLYRVYRERIKRGDNHYSTSKLGAYAQDLNAISAFFPEGWEKPASKGLSEEAQAWLLASTSFCLMSLGRLPEAVESWKSTVKIYDKLEDWENAAATAKNLGELYLHIGSLKDAEHAAQQGIAYADRLEDWENAVTSFENVLDYYLHIGSLKDAEHTAQQGIAYADRTDKRFQKMLNRIGLATTLHRQGYLLESLTHFEEAEKIQKSYFDLTSLLFNGILAGCYCSLLLDHYADKEKYQTVLNRWQKLFQLWSYLDSLLTIAFDHFTIARILFALNRSDEASAEFDEAVRGIRKANKVEFTPEILLARAKFFRHQQQFPEAWHDLHEANEIIERCGMKLYAVDANLLEGNLFLDKDDGNEAMKCYKQAKELIEYTGYHLRDAELDLLAARLADACQDSDKAQEHLDKSYQSIERIGYWGFLPEWERVKSSFRR